MSSLGGDCCDGVDGWCCDGVDGWCCDGVDGWEVGFSIRYVSLGYCVCSDDIGVCSDDVWYAVLFFEKGKNCFLNNDKKFLGKMVFKIGKRCGTRPKIGEENQLGLAKHLPNHASPHQNRSDGESICCSWD